MKHDSPVEDADGFVHSPYEEWVGYPMTACTCGHRWPCPTVLAHRATQGESK